MAQFVLSGRAASIRFIGKNVTGSVPDVGKREHERGRSLKTPADALYKQLPRASLRYAIPTAHGVALNSTGEPGRVAVARKVHAT
jgi:hypothetical protein